MIYYEWMSVQVFPSPAWNRPTAICGIHTPIQLRVTSTTCLSNYTDDTLVNSILFAITQHHKIAGPTRLFMGQKFSRQMAKKSSLVCEYHIHRGNERGRCHDDDDDDENGLRLRWILKEFKTSPVHYRDVQKLLNTFVG